MSTEVEHAHSFAYPCTRCDCGMTLAEARQLRNDEATGRPHAAMTTKPVDQHGRAVDESVEIAGHVIITWPANHVDRAPSPIETCFTDVATGLPLVAVLRMNLAFGWEGKEARDRFLIAELTMLCDEEGQPLIAKTKHEVLAERYGPDGEPLVATFNFVVVENQVWR